MIKIEPSLQQQNEKSIEELHWDWFYGKFNRIHNKNRRDKILKNVLHIQESDLEILIKKPLDNPDFIELNEKITAHLDKHKNNAYYKRWINAIGSIFKYDDFTNEKFGWCSYAYFKAMGINVCPYCNRTYIFTVCETEEKNKKGKATNYISEKFTAPEIDHFLPQEQYPHLACSLYNFIPSCHACNHTKSSKIVDIIYPHREGFEEDGSFRAYFNDSTADLNSLNCIDIKIRKTTPFSLDPIKKKAEEEKCLRISNSVQTFHLAKIYKEHEIELGDLFKRYRNYCYPKIKDILYLFQENELNDIGSLNTNQIKAILSLYAKKMKRTFLGLPLGVDNNQYPLRKFKEDIINQLDKAKVEIDNERKNSP